MIYNQCFHIISCFIKYKGLNTNFNKSLISIKKKLIQFVCTNYHMEDKIPHLLVIPSPPSENIIIYILVSKILLQENE